MFVVVVVVVVVVVGPYSEVEYSVSLPVSV